MAAIAPSTAFAEAGGDPLEPLRRLYLEAVEEKSAIAEGLAEIDSLRAAGLAPEGGRMSGVLAAYEGALITLRAKHGFWPHDRLRHLRGGLSILDEAVHDHPGVAEIRYLRLMSCYYLPGILGRGESVQQDFDALAELLPEAREEYPPRLFDAIVSFVLENGSPTDRQRLALEAVMAGPDT